MQRLRRSFSISRYRSIDDEDDFSRFHSQSNNEANSRGSFDTLVIPGRTRYPSNQAPAPQSIDLRIAENLLQENPKALNASKQGTEHKSGAFRYYEGIHRGPDVFQSPFDSESGSRVVSSGSISNWSAFSFNHSSLHSYASCPRVSVDYLNKFNHLAAKHGLGNLSTFEDVDEESEALRVNGKKKPSPRKSIWGRLVRSSSSSSVKDLKPPRLKHKASIGSILSRRPTTALKCQSLEETYRLGGVSIVYMPSCYCAVDLIVPVYLAATANYLVRYGQCTAGIFRIPGQSSMVNALYDHYAAQISSAEKSTDLIHTVVGASDLPTEIHCTTHDVASAFKRFLWDMPGGILGSLPLFNSLHEIASFEPVGEQEGYNQDQARLIALALLCLKSVRRIALISTVFGLLALLHREVTVSVDSTERSLFSPVETMNSKALGVIFAPLLLGKLTDKIDVDNKPATSLLQSSYVTPTRGMFRHRKSPKSTYGIEQSPGIATGLKRTSAAALVVEMLICNWREVVQQVKSLEGNPKARTTSVSASHPYKDVNPIRGRSGDTTQWDSNIGESFQHQTSQRCFQDLPISKVPQVRYEPNLKSSDEPLSQQQKPEPKCRNEARSLESQSGTSEDVNHVHPGPKDSVDTPRIALRLPNTPQIDPHALAWWEKKSSTAVQSRGYLFESGASSVEASSGDNPSSTLSAPARIPRFVISPIEPLSPGADNIEDGTRCADSEACSKNDTLDVCVTLDLPAITLPGDSSKAQMPTENVSCSIGQSAEPRAASSTLVPHFATREPSPSAGSNKSLPVSGGHQLIAEGNVKLGGTKPSNGLGTLLHVNPRKDFFFTPTPQIKKLSPSMIPKPVSDSFRERHQRASIINKQMCSNPTSAPQDNSARQIIENPSCSLLENPCRGQNSTSLPQFRAPVRTNNAEYPLCSSSEILQLRAPHPHPLPEEPPVARRLDFKAPQDNARTKSSISDSATCAGETCLTEPEPATGLLRRENVGTLYKEIRKLKTDLDERFEENFQLRQQLDAVKRFRSAGTLSHQLREKEREVRVWRHRAECAEATLFRQRGKSDITKGSNERGGSDG